MIVTNATPSAGPLAQVIAEAAQTRVPRLYAVGDVPPKPGYPYGVYSVQLGRGDSYTLDSRHGVRWLRVTFQGFGRTADSAVAVTEAFLSMLLDVSFTGAEGVTTPLHMELDPTPPLRDQDDAGVVGVTVTLIATIEES